MPLRKTVPKRRRVARPRKMFRKRRMGANGVPDVASLTESIPLLITSQQSTGVADSYNLLALSVPSFTRAQGVAQYYQYFRIKRVTYIYKPTFDTFAPGGNSVPYLYWSICKTGEAQILDQAALMSRGAKPIRLDDKNVTISYAPCVGTQNVLTNAVSNNGSSFLTSPWLTTDDNINLASWSPSTVTHSGHYAMITCISQLQFDVQCQVEFEFKKPRVLTQSKNVGQTVKEVFDISEPSPSMV